MVSELFTAMHRKHPAFRIVFEFTSGIQLPLTRHFYVGAQHEAFKDVLVIIGRFIFGDGFVIIESGNPADDGEDAASDEGEYEYTDDDGDDDADDRKKDR